MTKKLLDPNGRRFQQLANELARSYVQISQCLKCGHPVRVGFSCEECGDRNPYEPKRTPHEELTFWLRLNQMVFREDLIAKMKELGCTKKSIKVIEKSQMRRWYPEEVLWCIKTGEPKN